MKIKLYLFLILVFSIFLIGCSNQEVSPINETVVDEANEIIDDKTDILSEEEQIEKELIKQEMIEKEALENREAEVIEVKFEKEEKPEVVIDFDTSIGSEDTEEGETIRNLTYETCSNYCCGDKDFCGTCIWPEYGTCWNDCNDNSPDADCDAICWQGNNDFMANTMETC
ncbi:hypothetical protein HOK68_01155 [Candidatus Woesearchaeota archaeon]|jgi:hypothetical protein|nr:hypothetical protein [Candidatus Woesearchaeota archaeon]MBT4387661.1 hypothetical protein [Candidatus Woesearchaeota archaeon]MBT4595976.1 hypothetical protein [Candidatus Woesearchaeota archaeon]MBT5741106.1 hypothetical protein [Candidatus Woesearchaeota archaeon]MBT6505369.1 hypothetical protein [Candidatus Woesearchaeota archaeon]